MFTIMTSVQHTEQRLAAVRVVPIAVLDDAVAAEPLADALADAGVDCVEVTLRTEAAIEAIRRVAAGGRSLVGAGTVLTREDVDRAVQAGARFVLSPGLSPVVVRHCQELGLPVFPGVATATEIQNALDLGVRVMKFFPAEQLGGPAAVRALAAPFPGVRFLPTGGVNPANLASYLAQPSVLAVSPAPAPWSPALPAGPSGSRSPASRRAGPRPDSRSADALPSTRATARPPENAT